MVLTCYSQSLNGVVIFRKSEWRLLVVLKVRMVLTCYSESRMVLTYYSKNPNGVDLVVVLQVRMVLT